MWPFPDQPEYVTDSPATTTPPVLGANSPLPGTLPLFGGSTPTYVGEGQTGPEAAPRVLATDIRCPAFGADGPSIAKGAPVVIAVPSGATLYRVSFSFAMPATPSVPISVFPIGADEPSSGAVAGSQLTVTPTWGRIDGQPVGDGAVKATLIVAFE